jgi:fused signal recognition particle receptor
VDVLREQLKGGAIKDTQQLRAALKAALVQLLEPSAAAAAAGGSSSSRGSALELRGSPAVILVVGVNGAGKTTTIGKLAYRLSKEGARVRRVGLGAYY